jgi:FKBP-type peptidyl-prolyl cis-trans isomerase
MKRTFAVALCAALALALALPVAAEASKADVSYALGMLIGESAKGTDIDVDIEALIAGVKDSMAGGKTKFTEAQANSMVQASMKSAADTKGAESLKAGKAYLETNKKKSGVKTTASGLQYEVIREGSGAKPKATDTVTVHYEGKLISGKVFDSSIARGKPATFALNGVIKGWTEGLQLMGVGAKYRFYVPSELGYGASGAGGDIGPNEVLIFEVELISIGAPKK